MGYEDRGAWDWERVPTGPWHVRPDAREVLSDARKAQGFKSQEHLDAWSAYYRHTESCAECRKPGPGVYLDDGFQPTQNRCAVARELFATFCRIGDR